MFENPLTERIAVFLRAIGLPMRPATRQGNWLLPGLTIDRDGIAVDEAALKYPGDLLHEAGHLAVSEPGQELFTDGGQEMAAIAWSYAAALHIGIDPAVVFHLAGYNGGSTAILENFGQRRYFGVPLLQYYGMTTTVAYPSMSRWVR